MRDGYFFMFSYMNANFILALCCPDHGSTSFVLGECYIVVYCHILLVPCKLFVPNNGSALTYSCIECEVLFGSNKLQLDQNMDCSIQIFYIHSYVYQMIIAYINNIKRIIFQRCRYAQN